MVVERHLPAHQLGICAAVPIGPISTMPLAKGAAEKRARESMPDKIVEMPRTAKKPEMSAAMVRMIKDAAAGPARAKVSILVAEPLLPC